MLNASQTAEAILNAAEGGGAGGPNLMMILLVGVLAVFFFILPMRRQKKMRQQQQERQEAMGPGTQVMTQFGLYGTVVEVNSGQNYAILETSPGNTVKVHLQTVTTILDENGNIPGSQQAVQAAAARAAEEAEMAGREGTIINGETVDRADDDDFGSSSGKR